MVEIINGFDIELSYEHCNILQQQIYVQLRSLLCFIAATTDSVFAFNNGEKYHCTFHLTTT